MELESRRSFNWKLLGSLTAFGLIETLHARNLFSQAVQPVVQKWMVELQTLCQDLKGKKLKDIEFQAKLEELYRQANLPELLKLVDMDKVEQSVKFPERGAANLGVDLSKVEGLQKVVFGKQIFGCKKDRSIVPHGHNNMVTGFIILRGSWVGKHYERVKDNPDHYLLKPTIDRTFKPGECSTVSDNKDNVHWFKAETDTAFIFNIHVIGYNADNRQLPGRVYVDPMGEKSADGLIVAKKISSAECHKKYG